MAASNTIEVPYRITEGLVFSNTYSVISCPTFTPNYVTFTGTGTVAASTNILFNSSTFSVPLIVGSNLNGVNVSNANFSIVTSGVNPIPGLTSGVFSGAVTYNQPIALVNSPVVIGPVTLPATMSFNASNINISNISSVANIIQAPNFNINDSAKLAMSSVSNITLGSNLLTTGTSGTVMLSSTTNTTLLGNFTASNITNVTGSGVVSVPYGVTKVIKNAYEPLVLSFGGVTVDVLEMIKRHRTIITVAGSFDIPTLSSLTTSLAFIKSGDRVHVYIHNNSGGTVTMNRTSGDTALNMTPSNSVAIQKTAELVFGRDTSGVLYVKFNLPKTHITSTTSTILDLTATSNNILSSLVIASNLSTASFSQATNTTTSVTGSFTASNVIVSGSLTTDSSTSIKTLSAVPGTLRYRTVKYGYLPPPASLNASNVTLTGSDIVSNAGVLTNAYIGGAVTWTMPTAAELSAVITGQSGSPNYHFEFCIDNTLGTADLTLLAASGVVIAVPDIVDLVVKAGKVAKIWLISVGGTVSWKVYLMGTLKSVADRTITGALNVTANGTFSSNVNALSNVTVSDSALTLPCTISAASAVLTNLSTLSTTTTSAMVITGNANMTGLSGKAGTALSNTLGVVGIVNVNSNMTVGTTLSVTGDTTLAKLSAGSMIMSNTMSTTSPAVLYNTASVVGTFSGTSVDGKGVTATTINATSGTTSNLLLTKQSPGTVATSMTISSAVNVTGLLTLGTFNVSTTFNSTGNNKFSGVSTVISGITNISQNMICTGTSSKVFSNATFSAAVAAQLISFNKQGYTRADTAAVDTKQLNALLIGGYSSNIADRTHNAAFNRMSIYQEDVNVVPRFGNLLYKSPYHADAVKTSPGYTIVYDDQLTTSDPTTYPFITYDNTSGSNVTPTGSTIVYYGTPVISNKIVRPAYSDVPTIWNPPPLLNYFHTFALETSSYVTGATRPYKGMYFSNLVEGSFSTTSSATNASLSVHYSHSNSSTVTILGGDSNNVISNLFYIPPNTTCNIPTYTQYVIPSTNSTYSLAIVNRGIPSGTQVSNVSVKSNVSAVTLGTCTSLICSDPTLTLGETLSLTIGENAYNIAGTSYSTPTKVMTISGTIDVNGSAVLSQSVPFKNYQLSIPYDATYNTLNVQIDYNLSSIRNDFYVYVINSKSSAVTLSCVNTVAMANPVNSFTVSSGVTSGVSVLKSIALPNSNFCTFKLINMV